MRKLLELHGCSLITHVIAVYSYYLFKGSRLQGIAGDTLDQIKHLSALSGMSDNRKLVHPFI